MDIEERKREYIKKKYKKIANDILELVASNDACNKEVKSKCYGLRSLYHFLDSDIDWIIAVLDTDNGTKEKSKKLFRCDSCEDVRTESPTF